LGGMQEAELATELASQWRRLTRAATIDQNHDQPSVWFSQTATAGAVMRATAVAARVSLRH